MVSASSRPGGGHRRWRHRGLSLVAGLSLVIGISGMAFAPETSDEPRAGLAWQTTWYENFAGPAGQGLSPDTWKYDTGQGIFGNNEVETMTNSSGNVHLDGHGDLDITALNKGGNWTSGRVQTTQKFGAQPGGELKILASIDATGSLGGPGLLAGILAPGSRHLAPGWRDQTSWRT